MLIQRERWRLCTQPGNCNQSKNENCKIKIKKDTLFQIGFGLINRYQKETGCFYFALLPNEVLIFSPIAQTTIKRKER